MSIKSFKHHGLEDFFYDGNTKGINPKHANKLETRLDRLDAATNPKDMELPGYRLHLLRPKKSGRRAINISGAWRLTFEFDHGSATAVDYEQYH